MQNVLDAVAWRTVANRLARSPVVLLALDFDGTLAPIVEHPDEATLPGSTADLLKGLAQRPGYRVAIVTGRALVDVKRRVGIADLIYCGNHGLEIEIEGRRWQAPGVQRARGALKETGELLHSVLRSLSGVVLENKGLSWSVHYRQAPTEVKQACLKLCSDALYPLLASRKVNVVQGKEVVEVQPALPWDKGACLRHLVKLSLARAPGPGTCIFLGDDTFDEPAFRAVRDMGGIGIVIGEKADTEARFFLPSVMSVEIFLHRLVSISHDR